MKTNWQINTLSEICDFYNGLWKGKEPPYINVGVIRNTNFTKDGNLDDSDIAYLPVETKQFSKRRLNFGDIILEKSGGGPKQPVGRVIIFDKKNGDYSFSNFTSAIRIKNSDQVDFNFLHRFLYFSYISGITESMQSHSTGIRNLDLNKYKEIEISYPPLPEQKRIVKTLDEAFKKLEKAKENAEKNLRNSKELFEYYLRDTFTNTKKDWEVKKLSEIAEYFNGLTYSPKNVSDEGIIVLRSSNVQNDELDFSDIVRVNCRVKEKVMVRDGDILMCSRNGSKRLVGKTATIKNLKEPMTFGTFMMIIRGEYNSYLAWFFKSTEFRKQIAGGENTMINQITRYMLDDVIVSFPPKKELKKVIEKLNELSEQTKKLESIYQKKISAIEELKKSILSKAFSKGL